MATSKQAIVSARFCLWFAVQNQMLGNHAADYSRYTAHGRFEALPEAANFHRATIFNPLAKDIQNEQLDYPFFVFFIE